MNFISKTYLRRPAGLSRVELDGVNVISVYKALNSLREPVGGVRVGEINIAGYGAVIVPPGRVRAALLVENQVTAK